MTDRKRKRNVNHQNKKYKKQTYVDMQLTANNFIVISIDKYFLSFPYFFFSFWITIHSDHHF